MGANENAVRAQYLSFSLRETEYAIGILKVKEILQFEQATRVPSTPRSVRGVINLRGQVVPVVDLAAKFGLGETAPTRLTCILIVEALVEGAATVVGILADSVQEVIELGNDDVEATPAFGTQVKVDFLLGVGKVGKRFVLLLDVDRVISADEREFAREVAGGAPAEPQGAAGPVEPADRARANVRRAWRLLATRRCASSGQTAATAATVPAALAVSDRDFLRFQALIHREAGIWLAPVKKALLVGRLAKRLRELGLQSYGDYYDRVVGDEAERIRMLDAICTNETHFFREPRHFEFLAERVFPAWRDEADAGRRPASRARLERRVLDGRGAVHARDDAPHRVPLRLGPRGARERPLDEGARARRGRRVAHREGEGDPGRAPQGLHAEGLRGRRRGS